MRNYVKEGLRVLIAAPTGGVDSGDFVVEDTFYGVAEGSADAGDDLILLTQGVFTLPKAAGEAWTVGAKLYWDAGNGNFTTTAGGNTAYGSAAFAAAASDDTTGQVRIG